MPFETIEKEKENVLGEFLTPFLYINSVRTHAFQNAT